MASIQSFNQVQRSPTKQTQQLTLMKSLIKLQRIDDDNGSPNNKKKITKELLSINPENLERDIEIYSWRGKTELPIAKVYSYKILPLNVKNKIILEVNYETPITRLSDLKRLPFFQIMYLIKESLIGFERLVDKVGSFLINDKMIFINKAQKCKVWWNQEIAENSFISSPGINTQQKFLTELYKLFEKHTIESKTSLKFFTQIHEQYIIMGALSFIDQFSKSHKIIISSSLNLNASLSINSPNKLTMSKYVSSKQINQSKVLDSKDTPSRKISGVLNSTGSFIKLQPSIIKFEANILDKAQTQISQIQKANVPKFLNKNSIKQQVTLPLSNPQIINRSFLNKSKSSNYFKNLKQSTFTKLDKSKHQQECSSFGEDSNSKITTSSYKLIEKYSPQSNLFSSRTPKQRHLQLQKNISFGKDSPEIATQQQKLQKSQLRQRKYSNDTVLNRMLSQNYQYKGIKILTPTPIKQQVYEQSKNVSLQNSLQPNKKPPLLHLLKRSNCDNVNQVRDNSNTMITTNGKVGIVKTSSMANNKVNLIKTSSDTAESQFIRPQPSSISPGRNQNGSFTNIFQKNGWKMQIQSLIGSNKSIRESIKDGKQERSRYLGSTLDFAKLARLGRTIQGSMTPDDEFRYQ